MSLIFLFIDGIGLASAADSNPFCRFADKLPGWELLLNGRSLTAGEAFPTDKNHFITGIDANLDTEGLPQSGTGQTALFTGQNAAKVVGRHFGPFPHSKIRPLLRTESFFNKLHHAGKRARFLNAYPPVFFERAEKTKRWSSSTYMVKNAGQKLNSTAEVMAGKALTAELFGDYWSEKLGINLPKRDGTEVAEIILNAAAETDLLFLEYYLTDKAGHEQDASFAFETLHRLDQVFAPLLSNLSEHTLLISSDHGNLEDLSRKTHTRNPVPLIAKGPLAAHFSEVKSITDVTPAMLSSLGAAEFSENQTHLSHD